MKICVSRTCLLAAALTLIAVPLETALADYGNCLAPGDIEIPKRLRTEQDVDNWQSSFDAYLLEAEAYLKCLLDYAIENENSLTNSELNSLRQIYERSENHVKKTVDDWNKAFGDYQRQVAQTRR